MFHVQKEKSSMSDKVSAIIPVYNCERFIRDAVESALCQTHPCHEVIVVDDGSTDGTAGVLKQYASTGRITYIYQENKGNAAARNTGLRSATGDYIAFLDSDDFWHDEKIERQLACLRANTEAALVFCDEYRIYGDADPVKHPAKIDDGEDLFEKFLVICYTTISSVMMKREVLEKIGVFNENMRYNVDYELMLRALSRFRMVYLPEYLLTRRKHDGSLTAKHYYVGYSFMDVSNNLKGLINKRQERTLRGLNVKRCWKSAAWLIDRGHFEAGFSVFLKTVRRYPPFMFKLPGLLKRIAGVRIRQLRQQN